VLKKKKWESFASLLFFKNKIFFSQFFQNIEGPNMREFDSFNCREQMASKKR